MEMRLINPYIQQRRQQNGHSFERYSEWLEITDDVKRVGYSLLEYAPVKSDSDDGSLSTVDDSRSYAIKNVAFEEMITPVRSREKIPLLQTTRDKIPPVCSRDEVPNPSHVGSGDEIPSSISSGEQLPLVHCDREDIPPVHSGDEPIAQRSGKKAVKRLFSQTCEEKKTLSHSRRLSSVSIGIQPTSNTNEGVNTVTPEKERITNTLVVQENDQGHMNSRGVRNRDSDSHEFLLRAHYVLYILKSMEHEGIGCGSIYLDYQSMILMKVLETFLSRVTLNDDLFHGVSMNDVNASFFVKVINDLEIDFVGDVDVDEIGKDVAVILKRISEADMSTFVVNVEGRVQGGTMIVYTFKFNAVLKQTNGIDDMLPYGWEMTQDLLVEVGQTVVTNKEISKWIDKYASDYEDSFTGFEEQNKKKLLHCVENNRRNVDELRIMSKEIAQSEFLFGHLNYHGRKNRFPQYVGLLKVVSTLMFNRGWFEKSYVIEQKEDGEALQYFVIRS